jgi:hypothetical protein
MFGAEVVNPAGEGAGLDDDDDGVVFGEELAQVLSVGGEGVEASAAGVALVDAGDALVLAEGEGENGGWRSRWWSSSCKLLWDAGGSGTVILSLYLAPPLAWILPAAAWRL